MTAKTKIDAMLERLAGTSYPQWLTNDLEAVLAAIEAGPAVQDAAPALHPAQRVDNMHFETMAALAVYPSLLAEFVGPQMFGMTQEQLNAQMSRVAEIALL